MVGSQPQPVRGQYETVTDRAQVLPALTGCDGPAGGRIPDDRRSPLVGDGHSVSGAVGLDGLGGQRQCRRRQCIGVKLHQAGRRGLGQCRRPPLSAERTVGIGSGHPDRAGADVDDQNAHRGSPGVWLVGSGDPEVRRWASAAPIMPQVAINTAR